MATKQRSYEEELQRAEQELAGLQYQKSQQVLDAERALADYAAQAPGEYVSSYQQRIDDLMDQILNRGGLEYSFDADPLYQQYRDSYTRSAKLALQDTMAQAAALTGGYGSSYAATAGSQAYQEQMAHLDDALPTLYGLALERWNSENDALQAGLKDLTGLQAAEWDAYRAGVEDYYTQLDYYTDAAQDAYDRDYKAYEARRAALQDLRDHYAGQNKQAQQNARDEAEYQLAVRKYEESVRQWEAEQAAAREKWQAQLRWDQEQFAQEMAAAAAKTAAAAAKGASAAGSSSKQTGSEQTTGNKQTGGSAQSSAKPASGGSSRKDTSGGVLSMSPRAQQIQREVQQQYHAIRYNAGGGMGNASPESVIRNLLQRHYNEGSITRAEANTIGRQWGVVI